MFEYNFKRNLTALLCVCVCVSVCVAQPLELCNPLMYVLLASFYCSCHTSVSVKLPPSVFAH